MLHCWVLWTNTTILICLDNTFKLLFWPSFIWGEGGREVGDIHYGILDGFINNSSSYPKRNKFSSEWSCFRLLASFVCVKKLKEKVSRKTDQPLCCRCNSYSLCFWQKWTGGALYSLNWQILFITCSYRWSGLRKCVGIMLLWSLVFLHLYPNHSSSNNLNVLFWSPLLLLLHERSCVVG